MAEQHQQQDDGVVERVMKHVRWWWAGGDAQEGEAGTGEQPAGKRLSAQRLSAQRPKSNASDASGWLGPDQPEPKSILQKEPSEKVRRFSKLGGAGSPFKESDKRTSWRTEWIGKYGLGRGSSPSSSSSSSSFGTARQAQSRGAVAKATAPGNSTKRISWRRASWGRKNRNSASSGSRAKSSVSTLAPIAEAGEVGQAPLEESNIAGIGSDQDRDLRHAAAKTEKAFKNAGKKVGIEVWRVENYRTKNDTPDFGVRRWPKDEYGNFYSGDSYIVLNTYHPVDIKGQKSKALAWDLHFWLGSESTQDEIGVAAYKSVELDALLNDLAVHHRETQFHESKLFMSYFKELKYLDGGIDSGFRKVTAVKYEPRLLMVRHTKRVTKAFQIPCRASNMNHGDCFILDTGYKVYRWEGAGSNFFEKNRSGLLQHNIVNSRNGKAVKANIDEDFWKVLGSESDIRPISEPYVVTDNSDNRLDVNNIKLFRLSDASGTLRFTKEEEGKVAYWKLDTNDVFIVHSNVGIWVWLGAKATKREKSKSMAVADQYLRQEGLPNTMTITAITEDQARTNAIFRGLFRG